MDAASLEAMEAPRTFHYVFAHRTLPMLAAHDAEGLLDGLEGNARRLLRLQWKTTCRTLGIEPPPSLAIGYGPGSSSMGIVALDYRGTRTIAGYRVGFVQLPLALQVREAHFVAVAHRAGSTRFLAWERTLDGRARIAEWSLTPQGPRDRRVGPAQDEASLDDFVDVLRQWLRAPKPEQPLATLVPAKRKVMLPRPRASRGAPAKFIEATPVVTWFDASLVAVLLLVWTAMIVVITLL